MFIHSFLFKNICQACLHDAFDLKPGAHGGGFYFLRILQTYES